MKILNLPEHRPAAQGGSLGGTSEQGASFRFQISTKRAILSLGQMPELGTVGHFLQVL